VGPRRRKSHRSHTRAQTKTKDNENHIAHEGYSRYEEDVVTFESRVDAEARETSRSGTPPRESNEDDHAVGGGKEKHNTSTIKECNVNARGNNNADTISSNRKSYADKRKRKGIEGQIPHPDTGYSGNTHYLGGSGRSTCQCWGLVVCRPILRKYPILVR
jgi:hypothetical protein